MKWLAIVLLATTALAEDMTYKRTDGLGPLADSPTATTIVVEFKRAPAGSKFLTKADRVYTKRGPIADACKNVLDGLCCPCNVKPDGRVPECGTETWYGESTTTGGCSQKVWPPDQPYEPPPWPDTIAKGVRRVGPRPTYVAGIVKRHGKRYPTKMR